MTDENVQRMREAAGRLMADGRRRTFWEIERELCPDDPGAVTVDALDLNAAVIAMCHDGELEKDPDGSYRAHVRRRPYECKMALIWLAKDLYAHAMQAECSREAEGYFLARGSVIEAMRTIEAAMESRYEDDCRKAIRRTSHDRGPRRPLRGDEVHLPGLPPVPAVGGHEGGDAVRGVPEAVYGGGTPLARSGEKEAAMKGGI